MWIGKESTVDKQAYAAIRTVQLCSLFKDKAVHYREVRRLHFRVDANRKKEVNQRISNFISRKDFRNSKEGLKAR